MTLSHASLVVVSKPCILKGCVKKKMRLPETLKCSKSSMWRSRKHYLSCNMKPNLKNVFNGIHAIWYLRHNAFDRRPLKFEFPFKKPQELHTFLTFLKLANRPISTMLEKLELKALPPFLYLPWRTIELIFKLQVSSKLRAFLPWPPMALSICFFLLLFSLSLPETM